MFDINKLDTYMDFMDEHGIGNLYFTSSEEFEIEEIDNKKRYYFLSKETKLVESFNLEEFKKLLKEVIENEKEDNHYIDETQTI